VTDAPRAATVSRVVPPPPPVTLGLSCLAWEQQVSPSACPVPLGNSAASLACQLSKEIASRVRYHSIKYILCKALLSNCNFDECQCKGSAAGCLILLYPTCMLTIYFHSRI